MAQRNDKPDARIVLFDGVCNLCHRSVRFIIKRDTEDRFRFASIQSEVGERLLSVDGLDGDLSTFYVIEPGGEVLTKSDAWLSIITALRAPWPVLGVLRLVPRALRDVMYDFIGRHRYEWFGRKDSCPLPDPALAHRFL